MTVVFSNNKVSHEAQMDSWQIARQLSEAFKPMPIAFTSAIRMLIVDEEKNSGNIRPVTKFQVARIFRSASFKSMLYYASSVLKDDQMAGRDYLSSGDLMGMYKSLDLAALIGLHVLYRKCRKIADPGEWDLFKPEITRLAFTGAVLGGGIPKIGIGFGSLIGALPLLILTSQSKVNAPSYRSYRSWVLDNNCQFDPGQEMEIWGCSLQQIATLALSIMGYGVEIGEAFMSGMNPNSSYLKMDKQDSIRCKMAKIWTDTLLQGLQQPQQTIPGDYYPLHTALTSMHRQMALLDDSFKFWFERNHEDISPELTPVLFTKEDVETEIPEELKEVFSMEEITAMEEEDFDDLIDQIDLEQEGQMSVGGQAISAADLAKIDEI